MYIHVGVRCDFDVPYCRHVLDVLHSISPTLSDLTSNTKCIEAAKSLDLSNMVSIYMYVYSTSALNSAVY